MRKRPKGNLLTDAHDNVLHRPRAGSERIVGYSEIPLDADGDLTAAQNGLAAPAEAVPDRLFEHGLVPCSPFGGNVFG